MSTLAARLLQAAQKAQPQTAVRSEGYKDYIPAIRALAEKNFNNATITDWLLRQTSKTPAPRKSKAWNRLYQAVRRINSH